MFVRDLREETIVLVSRSNGPNGVGGQGDSYAPSISASGRFVAFASYENGFADEDEDGLDVFVRDPKTGTTSLVSRASIVRRWRRRRLLQPVDLRERPACRVRVERRQPWQRLESLREHLRPRSEGSAHHGRIEGIGPKGKPGERSSVEPSISGGGRYVAFSSSADNLSGKDNDSYDDVFVRDLESSKTVLVSRRGKKGPGGGANSSDLAIPAGGRMVAFTSGADNLIPAGDDGFDDIFVRDLKASTTKLVSRRSGANGAKAQSNSFEPSISANGGLVAFQSDADNLSPDDNDDWDNVFVRDLGSFPPCSLRGHRGATAKAPTITPTTLRSRLTGASSPSSRRPGT